ncbi:hypothetical protein [Kibdelosporangium aridum]|uniref:DUF2637 domain-containing protein n=1 Tax=Kibdelosporangium aridum TaxID=2030 RepID=A0A1W2DPT4_KIBAR|nr:hypothetical protein [Kibdelosporangium aridum]SMC99066.1 hypothetical protein SAMN05661093_03631 [Kibdelosporangium aridum]
MTTQQSTAEQMRAPTESGREHRKGGPAGARGFYLVAAMSLAVSVDTSWRFFGERLGITAIWERAIMFAVVEVALIACGYAMRAGVQSARGRPGPARLVAWMLCGLSAYMALDLSGPIEGLARVALGPILGLVMLHLALGIEIRHAAGGRMTTWAKVGREVRERLLSRLGLADDQRDALARTRHRAAGRVAHLSSAPRVVFRDLRLRRALRASNAAHDPAMRERMLAELAAVQHMRELATLQQPSPWLAVRSPALPTDLPGNAASTHTGPLVNPASQVHDNAADHVHEHRDDQVREPHRPTRTTPAKKARRTSRAKKARVLYGDYLAAARNALTPGVMPTAKWAQEVTGCSAGTSVKLARELRDELATHTSVNVAETTQETPDRQVA